MAGWKTVAQVRVLIKLLVGSLVVFLSVSMLEEWEVFSEPWFDPPPPPELTEEERVEVDAVLRSYASALRHLYASRGDARFVERTPAAPAVLRETLDDIAYLEANGRIQEPRLMRLDLLSARPLANEAIEATTREYWVVETAWIHGGGADEPASSILQVRYRLVRRESALVIVQVELLERPTLRDSEG